VPGRTFIGERLALHDAVLMSVLQVDGQTIVGQVERVSSRRFEGPTPYDAGPLTFIGAAGSWGNVCLQAGERALVFLAFLPHAGRVYQGHWRAHFSMAEIDGNAVAIAHWDLTAPNADHADPLHAAAFLPDPARPARVAIPWRVVEDQLVQELGSDAETARPCLVLLPGMDGSGLLFDDFIAALGGAVRPQVIAYPADRALGYAELVALVRSRLPANQPYYLLGESFSSPVAIALAAERPPMLMGLIISCGFARNPAPAMHRLRALVRFVPLSHRFSGLAAPLLLGWHARPGLRHALQRALAPAPVSLLRHRLRAVLEVDYSAQMASVAVPVLYLQAAHDRIVPASAAQHMRSLQARLQVVTLHGPHLLLQAAPHEAAAAVRAFIGACSQSGE
jgi:pimeloyl-[acyl-carrier protein] methyl ester esterase